MKTQITRFAVGAILASQLVGCTNIQDDGTRTRTEGALAGAVLGGVLGAVIGAQSGDAGGGALLGAALGGGAGLAYGNHVANKKARYASEEQWLDACIAQARATNQRARGYNSRLSGRISRLRAEIASAKASGNSSLLREKKAEIINLQRETSTELKKVDSEIDSQQSVLGQASSPGLRSEVISLKSSRSTMSSNYDRLASLNREIDV